MLLVLGKPGFGTRTLLRALTDRPRAGTQIEGQLIYDGLTPAAVSEHFRGEVIFNDEDDVHFPTLTTLQTIKFALMSKVRRAKTDRTGTVRTFSDLFLSMFGMTHVSNMIVGNASIRGVSGGERKRVSSYGTMGHAPQEVELGFK